MDEYAKEIGDLEAQIDAMIEEEADKNRGEAGARPGSSRSAGRGESPQKEIAELQMQLEILRALYAQASHLYETGHENGELGKLLALRGYGDWTLDNVYAFVYEASVDAPVEGHHSFVGEIRDTDFERLLVGTAH